MPATSDSGETYGQCRCCLAVGYHKDIPDVIRKAYRDIFLKTFNLQLSDDETLPKVVCTPCVHKLIEATEFRQTVVESEQKLLGTDDGTSLNIEFVGVAGKTKKKGEEKSEENGTEENVEEEEYITSLPFEMKLEEEDEQIDVGDKLDATAAGDSDVERDYESTNNPIDSDDDIDPMGDEHLSPVTPLGVNYRRYLMSRLRGNLQPRNPPGSSVQPGGSLMLDLNQLLATKPKQNIAPQKPEFDTKGNKINRTIKQEAVLEETDSLEDTNTLEETNLEDTMVGRVTVKDEGFLAMLERLMSDDDADSYVEFEDRNTTEYDYGHTSVQQGSSKQPPAKHARTADKQTNSTKTKRSATKKPRNKGKNEKVRKKYERALFIKEKHLADPPAEPQVKLVYKYPKVPSSVDPLINYATFILHNSNALPFQYSGGKYMCAYCLFAFIDITELRHHYTVHDATTTFRKNLTFPLAIEVTELACTVCNFRVPNLDALVSHLEYHHARKPQTENEGSVMPFILTEPDLRCVHCDEKFTTFGRLLFHSNSHYQIHICDKCGLGFPSIAKLKAHTYKHEEETRGCPKCGVMLPTVAKMKYHLVNFHGKKDKYKCPICDLPFRHYPGRLKHMRDEHGRNIEFRCSECPSAFLTAGRRERHYRRIHLKLPEKRKDRKKLLRY